MTDVVPHYLILKTTEKFKVPVICRDSKQSEDKGDKVVRVQAICCLCAVLSSVRLRTSHLCCGLG